MYKEEVEKVLIILKNCKKHDRLPLFEVYTIDGMKWGIPGICGIFRYCLDIKMEEANEIVNYLYVTTLATQENPPLQSGYWFDSILKVGFDKAKSLRVEFLEDYLKTLNNVQRRSRKSN